MLRADSKLRGFLRSECHPVDPELLVNTSLLESAPAAKTKNESDEPALGASLQPWSSVGSRFALLDPRHCIFKRVVEWSIHLSRKCGLKCFLIEKPVGMLQSDEGFGFLTEMAFQLTANAQLHC